MSNHKIGKYILQYTINSIYRDYKIIYWTVKDIKTMKKQVTDMEMTLAIHTSDKGFYTK